MTEEFAEIGFRKAECFTKEGVDETAAIGITLPEAAIFPPAYYIILMAILGVARANMLL